MEGITGPGGGGGGEDRLENSTRNFLAVVVAVLVVGWVRILGRRSMDGRVMKSGFEEIIDTGSEEDESDEPGRL